MQTEPHLQEIGPLHGGSGHPSDTQYLGPTQVHIANGVSNTSAHFTWLTVVTDRLTDIPCYSVCSNRPHLRSTV